MRSFVKYSALITFNLMVILVTAFFGIAAWPYKNAIGQVSVWTLFIIGTFIVVTWSVRIASMITVGTSRNIAMIRNPLPLSRLTIEENEDVETVSQPSRTRETLIPSQSVSQKAGDMLDNCNRDVSYFLVDHPGASIREVERATRYSRASIGRTMAWRERSK